MKTTKQQEEDLHMATTVHCSMTLSTESHCADFCRQEGNSEVPPECCITACSKTKTKNVPPHSDQALIMLLHHNIPGH